jgi:hypothetical protein
VSVNVAELGPPVVESHSRQKRSDPVLDLLKRRAPGSQAPQSLRGAPKTRRGPFLGGAAPTAFAAAATLVEQMRGERNRDRILQVLVEGVRTAAGSVTVFAVRRDMVAGWLCSPDPEGLAVRDLRIAISASPLIGEALSSEGVLLARVPGDASHAPLVAVLGPGATGEIALTAVRVEGKLAALVVAGGLKDRSSSMLILAKYALAAGEALASLLRDSRR